MKSVSSAFNSFQPLLEDHYFGRLFCWRVHEGIKLGVDSRRIALYVQSFWQQSFCNHLKEEDILLLTDHANPLIQKAITDHLFLCSQFTEISDSTDEIDRMQLSNLAQALDEHILYEEKILFPYLKHTLSHNILRKINKSLAIENKSLTRQKYLYADEFWKGAGSSL